MNNEAAIDYQHRLPTHCFNREILRHLLEVGTSECETIALDWLSKDGKRYRPTLATAVYRAIKGEEVDTDLLIKLAVGIEAFHKASLIHDDIADEDEQRYGNATLYQQIGVGPALNVGDLLLAWGYRLIGNNTAEPAQQVEILRAASQAHQRLCIGQGKELALRHHEQVPALKDVLSIFADKTGAGFEMAIVAGMVAASADAALLERCRKIGMLLGIAYQIRDDLLDILQPQGNTLATLRPLLVLALTGNYSDQTPDTNDTSELCRQIRRHLYEYEQNINSAIETLDHKSLRDTLRQTALPMIANNE